MITKAHVLALASGHGLLPTTIEKDYVLGWLLAAISGHHSLSRWVFKGGTCLKKCFFETYRFSEDLDFTVPEAEPLSYGSIVSGLKDVAAWVEAESGVQFPTDRIAVEQYLNPRGKESFQGKITYVGPLNLPRQALQRIKFDITQDELLADATDLRAVFHPYEDAIEPAPRVRSYSVDEILAEKTRALYERQGRARDVYDTIHLSRDFRDSITPKKAADLLRRKFAFKGLPAPSVAMIIAEVKGGTLRADWEQQLAHQLPKLPPVDSFLTDLRDAIAWWFEPESALPQLAAIPTPANHRIVPRQRFPEPVGATQRSNPTPLSRQAGGAALETIRFAARNRLCVEIRYHGVARVAEPYSLRRPATGNLLLYVYERTRGGAPSQTIKAFKVNEIATADITDTPFAPRYSVEL